MTIDTGRVKLQALHNLAAHLSLAGDRGLSAVQRAWTPVCKTWMKRCCTSCVMSFSKWRNLVRVEVSQWKILWKRKKLNTRSKYPWRKGPSLKLMFKNQSFFDYCQNICSVCCTWTSQNWFCFSNWVLLIFPPAKPQRRNLTPVRCIYLGSDFWSHLRPIIRTSNDLSGSVTGAMRGEDDI